MGGWGSAFGIGPRDFAAFGAKEGGIMGMISDPMDLFGERAKLTREEANKALRSSLDLQSQAQMDAYNRAISQQKPYYDAGVNALAQLQTPGALPPSEQYQRDMYQGTRGINRALAAQGMFKSSNAYDRLGQFYNQLSGEEAGRQYSNALAPIKISQDAMGAQQRAADTYGAGMSNAYNNFGNQMAQSALQYGQNRADTYANTGNALNQMAQYYGSR